MIHHVFIGTFYYSKQRHRDRLPTIHSKGVNYTNNGGGRDTYISDSAGGLRTLYQPAAFKRTFYNNLRVYDCSPSPIKGPSRTKYNSSLNTCGAPNMNRSRSSLKGGATPPLTQDVFLKSQLHYGTKIAMQTKQVRDYQKNMDMRLSIPKKLMVSPNGKINKHVRNSGLDPVDYIKMREGSGERVDMAANMTKYFN